MKNIIKISLVILLSLLSVIACVENKTEIQSVQFSVSEISAKAGEHVGNTVSVKGTVVHVCEHGGKRMFIMGDNPEMRFKITASEQIGAFEVTLEGCDVLVMGKINEQIIDKAYLDNWEAELKQEHKADTDTQAGAIMDDHQENATFQIKMLRKRLAESGQNNIPLYSLECETLKKIKQETGL